MSQKTEPLPRSRALVLAWLGIFGIIAALSLRGDHAIYPDAESYIAIASGHLDQAHGPFSSRFLHPAVVYAVSRLGLPTETSFIAVAALALPLFVLAGIRLFQRYSRSIWIVFSPIPLILAPWLVEWVKMYYHPELFHAVLVALFFLLLPRFQWMALVLLFLQFLTRESTILLTLALLVAAGYRRNWRFALGAAGASLLGIAVSVFVSEYAQPNIHNLSGPLYLVAKVIHQFAFNCLGLQFLVDKHAFYREFTPLYEADLPHWRILGGITKIAFIRYQPEAQLYAIYSYLTTFGIVPMLFWANRKKLISAVRKVGFEVQAAVVYGLLCFATAPLLGNAIGRYLSYAWPAILIAAPAILAPLAPRDPRKRALLFGLHAWLLWGSWFWNLMWPITSVWSLGCLTGLAVLLTWAGFRIASNGSESYSEARPALVESESEAG